MREGDHLEYKEAWVQASKRKWEVSDDLLETIVAMANSSGGIIIIGVQKDPNDKGLPGGVTGVIHNDPQSAIRNRCASDIQPVLVLDTAVVVMPSDPGSQPKSVLLVRVPRGSNPPYILRTRGIIYIRSHEDDRPAGRADVDALVSRSTVSAVSDGSAWVDAMNHIGVGAQNRWQVPYMYLGVALTPTLPISPVRLGRDEDALFRDMCHDLIDYDATPVMEPTGVRLDVPGDAPATQASSARARNDGTISGSRFLRSSDRGDDGILRVDAVSLLEELHCMLKSARRWPQAISGETLTCNFFLATGNLDQAVLELSPNRVISHLPPADRRTPAQLSRLPSWVSMGEWEPETDTYELLEAEVWRLARQLQYVRGGTGCSHLSTRLLTRVSVWVESAGFPLADNPA